MKTMPTAAPTRPRRVARRGLATAFALAVVGNLGADRDRRASRPSRDESATGRCDHPDGACTAYRAGRSYAPARTWKLVREARLVVTRPRGRALTGGLPCRCCPRRGERFDADRRRRDRSHRAPGEGDIRGEPLLASGRRRPQDLPAVVVEATFACSGGNGGVCGDDVNVVWTSDPRLEPGGSVIHDTFFVDAVLRTGLVLASPSPRTLVVWRRRATDPAGEPGYKDIPLSQMPETAQYAIAADVRNDRVFVVTSTGLVATIRRASTREPSVEYHNVSLDGGSFSAAWAGGGRIALWGKDGLGSIDTRTWTTDSVADGVTGALATPYGMAAWTARRDGVSVYRPDGSRRLHVLDGTRVMAARAIGAYVYADTDVNTRYSIDLRTGRTVGPLSVRTQLVGPSFVAIP